MLVRTKRKEKDDPESQYQNQYVTSSSSAIEKEREPAPIATKGDGVKISPQSKAALAKKAESTARALLEARLVIDAKVKAGAKSKVSKKGEVAKGQTVVSRDETNSEVSQITSTKRAEAVSRSILETRLKMESKARSAKRKKTANIKASKVEETKIQKQVYDAQVTEDVALSTEENLVSTIIGNGFGAATANGANAAAKYQAEVGQSTAKDNVSLRAKKAEATARSLLEARLLREVKRRETERMELLDILHHQKEARKPKRTKKEETTEEKARRTRMGEETAQKLLERSLVVETKAREMREHEARRTAEECFHREKQLRAAFKEREVNQRNREAVTNEAGRQPKQNLEEKVISGRYEDMDLEEKAFNILNELGMIEITPDPDDPGYDASEDHAYIE